MSFVFNLEIDASDAENPIIRDANTYPLADVKIELGSAVNTLIANEVTLDTYTLTLALQKATFVEIEISPTNILQLGVKDAYQSGADTVLTLYENGPLSTANNDVSVYQLTTNTLNKAVFRPNWVLLSYLVAKPTAGDIVIELDNDNGRTASEWTFNTDDGGWFVLTQYAVPRYDGLNDNAAEAYSDGDVVFEMVNDEVVFYESLVDSNTDALNVEESWEVKTLTEVQTSIVSSLAADLTGVQEYTANIFISQKLSNLADTINANIDCKCLDVCEFPDVLKLAMYQEQITAMITRRNYTKAQETYEKAIQLAQDISV